MSFSVISIALTVVSAVVTQVQARKKKKAAAAKAAEDADKQKGLQIPLEGEILSIPVAYGRNKLGGLRTYHHAQHTYFYVAPEADTIVFTSTGDTRSDVQLGFYAIATEIGANGYFPPEEPNGPNLSLLSEDPTPYEFNPATNGMTQATADYAAAIFSMMGSVIKTLPPDTKISYKEGTTEYSVNIGTFEAPQLLVPGAAIGVRHNSFMLKNGLPADVSNIGLYSYRVISYDGTSGILKLSGANLSALDGAGYGAGMSGLSSFLEWDGSITAGFAPTLSFPRYGNRNEALYYRQVICKDTINDFVYLNIDDKQYDIPNLDTRVHCHKKGGQGDILINTNIASESTSKYPGTAHIAAVTWLNRDDPQFSTVPSLSFTIEGKLVKDISYDRASNTASLGAEIYSNSPALCLLDYLMNTEYGKGLHADQLDLVSFYWAHRCCDRLVQVNGTFFPPGEGEYWKRKGPRVVHLYEANLALDTSNTVRNNIEVLLECMGEAEFIWADGKYRLSVPYPQEYKAVFDSTSLGPIDGGTVKIGDPAYYNYGDIVQYPPGAASDVDLYMTTIDHNMLPPLDAGGKLNAGWIKGPAPRIVSAYITDDDIILSADISQGWTSLNDKLNYQTVKFFNEAKDFKEDTASWPPKNDPNNNVYNIYLAEDQGVMLESEITQIGDTSYAHAMSTAEGLVRTSRYSSTLVISVSRRFVYVEPGDFVKIYSTILGIPGELFRLTSVKGSEAGDIILEMTKYDARNLAWNAKDDEVIKQRNVYLDDIAQATNLQFTPSTDIGVATGGTLTWDAARDVRVEKYSIRVSYTLLYSVIPGATAWWEVGIVSGTSFKLPAMVAKPMTATVVAMSGDGKKQAPEYNVRTGSRWPMVSLVPLEAYLPIMATLTKSIIYVADHPTTKLPDLTNAKGNYRLSKGDKILNPSVAYSIGSVAGITLTLDDGAGATAGDYTVTSMSTSNGSAKLVAVLDGQTFTRELVVVYTGNNFIANGGADVTPPPTGVNIFSGITWYSIEHNNPTYTVNGGHAVSRIYAKERLSGAAAPIVDQAILVDQTGGTTHIIASEPSTNWYVWVSNVAKNGIESVKVGPYITTTGVDVAKLIIALESEINYSTLAQDLKTPIDKIPGIETDVSSLEGQYTVKISTDSGYVAGYGLAVTGVDQPSSQFIVKADRFAIGAPGMDTWPFIVQADATTINGNYVPAGVYMKDAMIQNGVITNAKIGVGQVDTLRIGGNMVTTVAAAQQNIPQVGSGGSWMSNTLWISSNNGFQNLVFAINGVVINHTTVGTFWLDLYLDGNLISQMGFSVEGSSTTTAVLNYAFGGVGAGGHYMNVGFRNTGLNNILYADTLFYEMTGLMR